MDTDSQARDWNLRMRNVVLWKNAALQTQEKK